MALSFYSTRRGFAIPGVQARMSLTETQRHKGTKRRISRAKLANVAKKSSKGLIGMQSANPAPISP